MEIEGEFLPHSHLNEKHGDRRRVLIRDPSLKIFKPNILRDQGRVLTRFLAKTLIKYMEIRGEFLSEISWLKL